MNEQLSAENKILDKECNAFCVYLVGKKASDYIKQSYREAHYRTDLVLQNHSNSFDHFIIHLGRQGILCTRMADIYTRWFYRRSALRSKLLLLMAILECAKSTYSLFETSHPYSNVRFWLGLIISGIRWILCLVASFIFFSISYPIVKCANIIRKILRAS
jgi:hypothetical protein